MGKLVLLDHDIVVIMVQHQPIVIKRSNIQELIKASINKWTESTDEDDVFNVFKKYPERGSYYRYLGSSGDQFFKENSKIYAVLEQNLLNEIVNAIRNQLSVLSFDIEQGEHLCRTLQTILHYSEKNNKAIGYRVFKIKSDPDPQFIVFEKHNLFQSLIGKKSIDSILQSFKASEIKKISSEDGIYFCAELTIKEEIVTSDGYGYDYSTKMQNITFDFSIANKKRSFWFKKSTYLMFTILGMGYLYYSMNVYNDQREWTQYLTTSCQKTLSGNLKTVFYGELDFWVHEDVSMSQWAKDMRDASENCNFIDTSTPNGTQERLACVAIYKEKWDWFNRCQPIVKRSCYLAGGRC